jgi:hypothetical protein
VTARTADILDLAADLIEPPGAWTRGGTRVAGGRTTWSEDPRAVSWCAISAISRVAGGWATDAAGQARACLRRVVGVEAELGVWNDDPARTQPEVVAMLREAAKAEREGEHA